MLWNGTVVYYEMDFREDVAHTCAVHILCRKRCGSYFIFCCNSRKHFKVPTEEEKMKTFALSDVAQMSAVTNGAPEDDGDFLRQIHDVETATYAMLKKGQLPC